MSKGFVILLARKYAAAHLTGPAVIFRTLIHVFATASSSKNLTTPFQPAKQRPH